MGRAARLKKERKEERKKLLSCDQVQRSIEKQLNRGKAAATEDFARGQIGCILWVLHSRFGWGKIRLTRFLNGYKKAAKSLTDFYEEDYHGENAEWLFARKLKEETGIDVYQLWDIGEEE